MLEAAREEAEYMASLSGMRGLPRRLHLLLERIVEEAHLARLRCQRLTLRVLCAAKAGWKEKLPLLRDASVSILLPGRDSRRVSILLRKLAPYETYGVVSRGFDPARHQPEFQRVHRVSEFLEIAGNHLVQTDRNLLFGAPACT